MEEARVLYEKSVRQKPDILQTVLGWAKLEEADRKFEAALALLDKAEAIEPNNPSVHLTRATVLARLKRPEAALALLDEPEAEAGDARPRLGPAELSEKGRLLDQLGRHDEAFAAFDAGKKRALEFGARPYMAEAASGSCSAQCRIFHRPPAFHAAARAAARRHAAAHVHRRLSALRHHADRADPERASAHCRRGRIAFHQRHYPDHAASAGQPAHLSGGAGGIMDGRPARRAERIARLLPEPRRQERIFRDGAEWFTDKMPLNETHLGLISLLFPESPIIHVIRHPLDVLLSVYSNHLTHGFFCAAQLETIAQHYVLIADLILHYKQNLSMRYLPVRYEDMVADQEKNVRKILDFIGVAFDPKCLSFEQNTRYARTASYAQVTEKLYDRSRFRYRPYLTHLSPVLEILAPVIDRLGYSVDYPSDDRLDRRTA
jgi:tetratricopeptide (TPR) repeat protein